MRRTKLVLWPCRTLPALSAGRTKGTKEVRRRRRQRPGGTAALPARSTQMDGLARGIKVWYPTAKEPMRRRHTKAAHPRTNGSTKASEEVRLLRRRVEDQTKEGRMSPRGATTAVAAGSPLPTTLPRLLATDGTSTTAMPRQPATMARKPAAEVVPPRRPSTVAAVPTAAVLGLAALTAQPRPPTRTAVAAAADMVAAAEEAAEAAMVVAGAAAPATAEAPTAAVLSPAALAAQLRQHTGTAAVAEAAIVAAAEEAAEAAMAVAGVAAAATAAVVGVETLTLTLTLASRMVSKQELRRTVSRISNRANPEWTTEALAASTVSSTRQTGTQLGLYEWSVISPPGLGGDPPPTWTRLSIRCARSTTRFTMRTSSALHPSA